eukprot:gene340-717_t
MSRDFQGKPKSHLGVDLLFHDLEVKYGPNVAVSRVDGFVPAGSLVAIMGSTGAGKTSLLKALADQVPISNGRVLYDGKELNQLEHVGMKHRIGFIDQDDVTLPMLPVRDTLIQTAYFRNPDKKACVDLVDSIMKTLKIDEQAHQTCGTISGGQRKRFCIARELVTQPELLLADEPTTGLDSALAKVLIETLKDIAVYNKTTIVCSVQQPSENIFTTFDMVMFLRNGECIYFGPPKNVLAHIKYFGSDNVQSMDIDDGVPNFMMDVLGSGAIGDKNPIMLESAKSHVKKAVQEAIRWYAEHPDALARQQKANEFRIEDQKKDQELYLATWWRQFIIICKRLIAIDIEQVFAWENITIWLMLQVICGFIFFRPGDDFQSIQSRTIAALFLVGIPFWCTTFSCITRYYVYSPVLMKDLKAGNHGLFCYWFARNWGTIWLDMIMPFFASVIFYLITWPNPKFYVMVISILCIQVFVMVYVQFPYLVSQVFGMHNAFVFTSLFVMFSFLWNGYLSPPGGIVPWLRWLTWVPFFNYAYNIQLGNVFNDELFFTCTESSVYIALPSSQQVEEILCPDDAFCGADDTVACELLSCPTAGDVRGCGTTGTQLLEQKRYVEVLESQWFMWAVFAGAFLVGHFVCSYILFYFNHKVYVSGNNHKRPEQPKYFIAEARCSLSPRKLEQIMDGELQQHSDEQEPLVTNVCDIEKPDMAEFSVIPKKSRADAFDFCLNRIDVSDGSQLTAMSPKRGSSTLVPPGPMPPKGHTVKGHDLGHVETPSGKHAVVTERRHSGGGRRTSTASSGIFSSRHAVVKRDSSAIPPDPMQTEAQISMAHSDVSVAYSNREVITHVESGEARASVPSTARSESLCAGASEPWLPGQGMSIAVKDLQVVYQAADNDIHALKGVSFSVKQGELMALMGGSGSGKTTTLHAILNKIPESVTGGEVYYNGYNWKTSMRQYVGFVEQDDIIIPSLTLRQSLMYTAQLRVVNESLHVTKVNNLLTDLQLDDCADMPLGSVSAGQRKRFCIARELLGDPSLLILDEPTSALDSTMSRHLMDSLRNLVRNYGMTIISSIHQPSQSIFRAFDTVMVLDKGQQFYFGPPSTVLSYFAKFDVYRPQSDVPMSAAEFMLDFLVLDQIAGLREPIAKDCEQNARQTADNLIENIGGVKKEASDSEDFPDRETPKWWKQCRALSSRQFKLEWTDYFGYESTINFIGVILVTGLPALNIAGRDLPDEVFIREAIANFTNSVWMLFPFQGGILRIFAAETVLRKEISTNSYSLPTYWISRHIITYWYEIIWPIVWGLIVWWMWVPNYDVGAYFAFVFLNAIFQAYLWRIVAMMISYLLTLKLVGLTVSGLLAFSVTWQPFFLPNGRLPPAAEWIRYLSPITYMYYMALYQFFVPGLDIQCASPSVDSPQLPLAACEGVTPGEFVPANTLIDSGDLSVNVSYGASIGILAGVLVVALFMSYWTLRFRLRALYRNLKVGKLVDAAES